MTECTVALVSTAGIARNDDRPFDQGGERRNPWWGDPSFRVIPLGTSESDVRLYHLHIDPRFGQADLDVVLPMRRLTELAHEGVVRQPAARHYSIMGYILEPDVLVGETAPAIAERMRRRRGRGRSGAGMTLLLPVRWTGSTRDRSERHPDRFPLDDSGSDARGRRTPARGNQLSDESSAWESAPRRRSACGAARDAGGPAPCGGAGHVRRAAVCVA